MSKSHLPRIATVVVLLPTLTVAAAAFLTAGVVVDASVYDAGTVRRGKLVTKTFAISNEGWRALTLDRIDEKCFLSAPVKQGTVIGPHEKMDLPVTLNTKMLPDGESYHSVIVTTHAPFKRSIELKVKVNVVSEFSVSADHIRIHKDAPSAAFEIRADGASVVNAVATDPRVTARIVPLESAFGTQRVRITATADPGAASAWNLGNILVSTTSSAYPQIRVPVRGGSRAGQ